MAEEKRGAKNLIPPFKAYKGTDPYVFISYAHANAAIAYPHMIRLYNRGYRIWYDQGIDAAISDWGVPIEDAIQRASVFIIFLTPESMGSPNVISEFTLATNTLIEQRHKSLPLLKIIILQLGDFEYQPGWKLRIGANQVTNTGFFRSDDELCDHICESIPASVKDSAPKQPARMDGEWLEGIPEPLKSLREPNKPFSFAKAWKWLAPAIAVLIALVVGVVLLLRPPVGLGDGSGAVVTLTPSNDGSPAPEDSTPKSPEEKSPHLMDFAGISAHTSTTIAAGFEHSVGLKSDGTVVAEGNNWDGQCFVYDWRDIISISAGCYHTAGLKRDGTVVAVGIINEGIDVSNWNGIISIADGGWTLLGLQTDGTVLLAESLHEEGYNVSGWENITAISAGYWHAIGLKSDGTVVGTGTNENAFNGISDWTDIIAVSAGDNHTIGLRTDGTVVSAGGNDFGQRNVLGWNDIVAISAGGAGHTVGLKSDGTVVATGNNEYGQCDVSDWSNIVAVAAGGRHTIGQRADGTVVSTGDNRYGQCSVNDWSGIATPTETVSPPPDPTTTPTFAPVSETVPKNLSGNIMNGSGLVYYDGYYYTIYGYYMGHAVISRIGEDIVGGNAELFADIDAWYIFASNGYIYAGSGASVEDGAGIYKISVSDPTDITQLSNERIAAMLVLGNDIFYSTYDWNYPLCKIDINGNNKTEIDTGEILHSLFPVDDKIYFMRGDTLFSILYDGGDLRKIADAEDFPINFIMAHGNSLFFSKGIEGGLYETDLDFKGLHKISDAPITSFFNIVDEYIYYSLSEFFAGHDAVYRMDLDGGNAILINDCNSQIYVFEESVFYLGAPLHFDKLYVNNKAGTDEMLFAQLLHTTS